MLNNEQLIESAEKTAQIFLSFASDMKRAKTTQSRSIEELLDSTNPKQFIEGLIPIVEKGTSEIANAINVLVGELNKMPRDNFSYFITLIRFKYAYLNRKE